MLMHAAVGNTNLVPAPASTSTHPLSLEGSFIVWATVTLLMLPSPVFLAAMRGQIVQPLKDERAGT
jgi:hypothetical protein